MRMIPHKPSPHAEQVEPKDGKSLWQKVDVLSPVFIQSLLGRRMTFLVLPLFNKSNKFIKVKVNQFTISTDHQFSLGPIY